MISLPTKKIAISRFTAYCILFAAVFVKRKLQNSHMLYCVGQQKKRPSIVDQFLNTQNSQSTLRGYSHREHFCI